MRGIARRLDRNALELESGWQVARAHQVFELGHDHFAEMREQIHQVVA
jgi:hypothetical protein